MAIRLARSKDHTPHRAPAERFARHTPRNRQFKIALLHAQRDSVTSRGLAGNERSAALAAEKTITAVIALPATTSRERDVILDQAIACFGKVVFNSQ